MLPPVLLESKKRLEEVRKIYGRAESVSYKNSMPSTSQGKRFHKFSNLVINRGYMAESKKVLGELIKI